MKTIDLYEGYFDSGNWHEVNFVGFIFCPAEYDFSLVGIDTEKPVLFIPGKFAGYNREENAITYTNKNGEQSQLNLPENATFQKNINGKLSYSSDDLIEEVEADIAEFGADEEVCVIVEHFPNEGVFFYTDYDFENIPEEELVDNEDTVFMTLGELLPALKKQNSIMGDEYE